MYKKHFTNVKVKLYNAQKSLSLQINAKQLCDNFSHLKTIKSISCYYNLITKKHLKIGVLFFINITNRTKNYYINITTLTTIIYDNFSLQIVA